jgi:predicted transcriptional regulator of viral defense system
MREERRSHTRLARLASRQHGVVTNRQLGVLGFSSSAVGRMSGKGLLHRVHRGVYAVGHAGVSDHGRCLAAVAACGAGALLSHDSAAWLWGLVPVCPATPHVTVASRGRSRAGIRVHHAPSVAEEGRAEFERVPVTPVARTLLDLAATGAVRRLESAVDRAERLNLLDLIEIDAMLARRHGDPGSAKLGRALELHRDPAFTRAKSERIFLDLARTAGLPRPACNLFVAGHEIDAYWERERFAVEVDGWDTHRTRRAFERDRLRQEELKLTGIDSIRVTARRLEREPSVVGARLARLLAERRRSLGLER